MKKIILGAIVIVLLAGIVMAAKPTLFDSNGMEIGWAKTACTTIQSGELLTSTGETITTGFDEYGYNYQAHQYIGLYGNYQRPPEPVDDGYKLMMKWNDAWLSNVDCDGNGLLDRHYGYTTYTDSGAWLTNHMSGEYIDGGTGEVCHWTYFVKIITPSSDDYADGGIWYTADGTEIGPVIWGAFAVIEEVSNDPCAGENGILYHSPSPVGFGLYNSEDI